MKKIGILIFTLFIFRGISFGISIFEIKGVISKNLDISLTISHDSLYNQNLTIYDCRFSYKNSSVNSLTPIYLLIKNNKNNNSMQFFFFATDGSKINIKIESLDSISFGKGIQISGIPFQLEENDFISNILPKQEKYYRFYNDKINIIRSGQFSKLQLDSMRKEISDAKSRYISEIFDFVVLNKHSYFSLYVFKIIILKPAFTLSLERSRIVSAFNLYDGEIKKSALWLEVSKIISLKQSLEVGKKAPNFYFKTDSHKNYSLYSLLTKEKMLLIFTAKYCGGCIQQIPIIKEIKRNSGDKVQIVYVSLDKTQEEWLTSIKKNAYPGLQTCDIKQYNNGESISDLFNVELIPQIFLIDSNGEIMYNNIFQKDDDELSLLKKKLHLF